MCSLRQIFLDLHVLVSFPNAPYVMFLIVDLAWLVYNVYHHTTVHTVLLPVIGVEFSEVLAVKEHHNANAGI